MKKIFLLIMGVFSVLLIIALFYISYLEKHFFEKHFFEKNESGLSSIVIDFPKVITNSCSYILFQREENLKLSNIESLIEVSEIKKSKTKKLKWDIESKFFAPEGDLKIASLEIENCRKENKKIVFLFNSENIDLINKIYIQNGYTPKGIPWVNAKILLLMMLLFLIILFFIASFSSWRKKKNIKIPYLFYFLMIFEIFLFFIIFYWILF